MFFCYYEAVENIKNKAEIYILRFFFLEFNRLGDTVAEIRKTLLKEFKRGGG